jgi:formylglycine-generating enzyme required for sulfatase activity
MLFDLNPPEFPAVWASAWGQDGYGLWQAFTLNGVRQVMRWIPPGSFLMGSPQDEPERHDEEIQHRVSLTQGYWLAESACTQELWQAVMGDNPSDFKDNPQNPVESISWNDCVRFFARANELLQGRLRLRFPNEAAWEYACRAGTDSPFWWGKDLTTDQANYDGNYPYAGGVKGESRGRTVEVLAFDPNPWGLYQMHGNVWEWCADWDGPYPAEAITDPCGPAEGQRRVLRGGSWFNDGRFLRSAFRLARRPDSRAHDCGLRLAGG